MEFGVFHEFPRSASTEADAFAQAFEQIDAADEWGLDVMWLSELHFSLRSLLSAPLIIASAVAARTKRIKIGTAVQLLPLCHPVRLAEEVATLDHVSRGRLIFGVGRSSFPRNYQGYGVPYSESRERFREILEILKLAWTQPHFSYHGTYHHFEEVFMVPKPYQRPYPPIRVAAASADTYTTVGTLGHPLLLNWRFEPLTDMTSHLRNYREAYKAAGHAGDGEVYLCVPVYVAKTAAQARDEPKESVMHLLHYLGRQLEESAARQGASADERGAAHGRRLQTLTYDEALSERLVVGTPEMVIDRLAALREQLGLNGILAELNSGGLIPQDCIMKSLRLFCQSVMPRFK
jgi:alkanesulfonate monooxygenase SsuD/methylene tetrahydromethanopterin reductase-like flavin-dependent oxidoreductase (luciferase family)